jgi:cellulose synthase/poly-beta-1,6-N-acetylglucosamine synthase-like glycosyltransferase
MAYNEEANILGTLRAIIGQENRKTCMAEIIVVASGCTDRTVPIVREYMEHEPQIRLIVQERREGKASAINLFLREAISPILALVGADTIPEKDALERLCVQFADSTVGMVGARPVPVNDQDTFTGHAVHVLWRLHDSMARRVPKLGEVVAFRNVVEAIPTDTAVDEISIQASIASQGLRMVYVPEALVLQ